ncbi:hypothetical protein WICMUC_000799 [Wickerhamomyces mucosus]|uniref:DNA primase large subunit n=1 Tax=Wickerhamomyces mucosus TaxID=1378264 RepID=A0A9P8PYK7_9ASCO|nr:hypothetical protein WICMUC_000799 [Wickerhamomyces mucosus]
MFKQSKRRTAGRKNFDITYLGDSTIESYIESCYNNSKLSLYLKPPIGEITLEEFEIWAIDRIKILNEIESYISRSKTFKEIESIILPLINKLLPLNNFKDKLKDYYSHFILKLCFSRSKELRDKFVKIETILFKLRFNSLIIKEQIEFIKNLNLPWIYIDQLEKNSLNNNLLNSITPSLIFQLNLIDEQSRNKFFANEQFIKIPFELIPELLSTRSIYLSKGFAYIPQFQQLNLLALEFANSLKNSLISTSHSFPSLDEDDRLLPILNHLSQGNQFLSNGLEFLSNDSNENDINAISIKSLEITSNFPLCSTNLLDGLISTHHLKYLGRQQFGLFLKGLGLSLEESLKFWANEFTKSIGLDKFEKEYKYNIRHSYGLEGSKINYKPWDCRTILMKSRPNKGEYHGCPYRDFSKDQLKLKLSNMGLNENEILTVLDINSKGDYTNSCTKVLEFKTKGEVMDHITHPNLYFERMRSFSQKN